MTRPIPTTLKKAEALAERLVYNELLPAAHYHCPNAYAILNGFAYEAEGYTGDSLRLVAQENHLFTFEFSTTLKEERRIVDTWRCIDTGVAMFDPPRREETVKHQKWQATFACRYGTTELLPEHCLSLKEV